MGSRIMHAIIAGRVADEMNIDDRSSFIAGGIAADAVSPKDSSHFYRGDEQDGSRRIAHDEFFEKYMSHQASPFIQGYFTHLIADDLWLKGFYLPWLRNRMEADSEVFVRYHRDFQLLNGKLLHHYKVTDHLKDALKQNADIVEIDEVKRTDIENFLPSILDDMNFDQKDLEQPLSVFTLEQIIGYVETSVERGIALMKDMKKA
ncbi:hydrolase [Jeotgalibacillus aurantiacus]|uniref:hydrolase n=1 Tax=Jeotgalibacillus aurantiacus TaxID=2763266 RepID=UPI001D0B7144|nr:hydrolase [Jeotgalibacillus aurantiacus]